MIAAGSYYDCAKRSICIDKNAVNRMALRFTSIPNSALKRGGLCYLKIVISNSDSRPVYEQIFAQIKHLIISGELRPGDALPSMRFLAKELRISVITTKRAYEELERSGLIATVAGKGSFVAGVNTEFIREEHLRVAEEHLRQAIDAAQSAGISKEELIDILEMFYQNE